MKWQVLIIVWVLCVSGAEGCMFGKNNRNEHCLLCISLCACSSLLGRYFGDVHQQSPISGLIVQQILLVFCIQQLVVME